MPPADSGQGREILGEILLPERRGGRREVRERRAHAHGIEEEPGLPVEVEPREALRPDAGEQGRQERVGAPAGQVGVGDGATEPRPGASRPEDSGKARAEVRQRRPVEVGPINRPENK